jgi:hypothetical protein
MPMTTELSFDLPTSFSVEARESAEHRLFAFDGSVLFSDEMTWSTGWAAIESIRKNMAPSLGENSFTLQELSEGLYALVDRLDFEFVKRWQSLLMPEMFTSETERAKTAAQRECSANWELIGPTGRLILTVRAISKMLHIPSFGGIDFRYFRAAAGVSALVLIDQACSQAADFFACKEINVPYGTARLISIGMDLQVHAAFLDKYEETSALTTAVAKDARRQIASKAGRLSKANFEEARQFVQSEWEKSANEYSNNRSEFARVYSRLVKQHFGLDVTDRTIRESWLKSYRSTS